MNFYMVLDFIISKLLLPPTVERKSQCELEVDVVAADILNRIEVDGEFIMFTKYFHHPYILCIVYIIPDYIYLSFWVIRECSTNPTKVVNSNTNVYEWCEIRQDSLCLNYFSHLCAGAHKCLGRCAMVPAGTALVINGLAHLIIEIYESIFLSMTWSVCIMNSLYI